MESMLIMQPTCRSAIIFVLENCSSKQTDLISIECFFGSESHVAPDRNPGPGYDTLLLRLIPGYLLSACPHRQFHTLPGLLDSRAALPNSYPNALHAMQGGIFVPFLWWLLVLPSREANSQPTVWEADTLTTKPVRHGYTNRYKNPDLWLH